MGSTLSIKQREAKRTYDRRRYRRLKVERNANRPSDSILNLDELTVAYLAGLTDGDGTIYVTHTNRLRTYYPAIAWAMTDKPVLDWISGLLGCHTVVANNHTNLRRGYTSWGKSKFKIQWRTGVAGHRAQLLCERMLPYLHTKAGQARLVCEFPVDARSAPGVTLPEDIRLRRLELGRQISALNR